MVFGRPITGCLKSGHFFVRFAKPDVRFSDIHCRSKMIKNVDNFDLLVDNFDLLINPFDILIDFGRSFNQITLKSIDFNR